MCDQIDALDHFLVEAIGAADADPLPGSAYLEPARQPLRQLRAELAGRSATRQRAEQILDRVEQNIAQADTVLDGALDDRLNQLIPGRVRSLGPLSRQLSELRIAVARLYDDAHDTSILALSR